MRPFFCSLAMEILPLKNVNSSFFSSPLLYSQVRRNIQKLC
jgi:hypothetical protein